MGFDRCPCCGRGRPEPFYSVRSVPTHSCLILRDQQAARDYPTGDVELVFCEGCGFIYNAAFEPDLVDYGADYEDSQAHSQRWIAWAGELIQDLAERRCLYGGKALEIGCGKGDFLALLASVADMRGVGYDPAFRAGPLVPGQAGRLTFYKQDFTVDRGSHGADLTCVRHVLEHVPDPVALLETIAVVLADRPESVLLLEVPASERILQDLAFWDIYYEHCSYLTHASLAALLSRVGFAVLRVTRAFDDQYLIVEASLDGARSAAQRPAAGSIEDLQRAVALFAERVDRRIDGLRERLDRQVAAGGKTVLWGAGSKAVGYLTTLGIRDQVHAVVDIDPAKQGGFLAGTGHAVIAPELLPGLRPDHVLIMNPNYREEIETTLHRLGVVARTSVL
jgi:SAM-dependent methyltransferase